VIREKKYMEKNCCNPQCFQGKNYKAKFLTGLILKNKSTKKILETIITKKNERKKKSCRETL
jgi:hypothetical protein